MRLKVRSVCWTNGQCGRLSFFSNVLCLGLDYKKAAVDEAYDERSKWVKHFELVMNVMAY